MKNTLLKILERVDLPTLHKLVGITILNAIQSVNKGEDETELSKILVLKYENLILNEKPIREAIINSLSKNEIEDLTKRIGLNAKNGKLYENVIKFFKNGYNESKSKIFVDFLNLTDEFYFKKTTDYRTDKEIVKVVYGEQINVLSFLHSYQKRVKDEIMYRLNQNCEKSFFVQMPTGAGKTLTALESVVDLLRAPNKLEDSNIPQKNKFIVWIVDTNELAEQALQTFIKLWKLRGDRELPIYRVFKNFMPDFTIEQGGVVFAGFDKFYSILKNNENKSFESLQYLISNTEFLIVDEAHHSLAATYNTCINSFSTVPFIKIMGLSATPGTNDTETTIKLVEQYSNDKISIKDDHWLPVSDSVKYLQDREYLAKLNTKILETGVSSTDKNENSILIELAANSQRNEKIVEQIKLANINKESTVVFGCSLDHIYAILILCRANNIDANYIIGDVDQSERLSILNSFREREYYILINLDILSTGIDLPNIDKVIITRPINSPNLVSQILGRALRGIKNGGNKENTIINIKDNLLNFPSASYLYDYFEGAWEKIN